MHKRAKKESLYSQDKGTFAVFVILRTLVIGIMIRSIFRHEYESVFICVLTLILFMLPSIISKKLHVELPSTLERIILIFIFAAEILGEIGSFYTQVPNWDTILHTINGFNCAAIGFALVDLLNRNERFSIRLSPLFLAVVAFCFSMTVGVMWEFMEYTGDHVLRIDAQKDTVINSIYSVSLDETHMNNVIAVNDIADTIIVHSDGSSESLGLGGYLDIGINDTMKDLFVNLIGAVVFSIIGYFYVKSKGKDRFAEHFIPVVVDTHEETIDDSIQSQREEGYKNEDTKEKIKSAKPNIAPSVSK